MVSGVPKPHVLAFCSMVLLVVSSGRAHLGLEDAGELPFGQVDLPRQCRDGQVVGDVVAQPGQEVTNWFGVGCLPGREGGYWAWPPERWR